RRLSNGHSVSLPRWVESSMSTRPTDRHLSISGLTTMCHRSIRHGETNEVFSMMSFRYIVSDVDAAVTFYTTMLEFELEEQFGSAMAIVRRGDAVLWLAGPQSSAARPMPDGARPAPGGWNRIVIEVD